MARPGKKRAQTKWAQSKRVAFLVVFCSFLSGLTGLTYEILWIRQVAHLVGCGPFAVSIVPTIFMGGLGLGSYLAGRLVDRLDAPSRADMMTQWLLARFPMLFHPGAKSVNALGNLGIILSKLGGFEEAVAHYQEALRFKPGLAEIHNNLGVALRQSGKVEGAIAQFRQAWQRQLDYLEAQRHPNQTLIQ